VAEDAAHVHDDGGRVQEVFRKLAQNLDTAAIGPSPGAAAMPLGAAQQ